MHADTFQSELEAITKSDKLFSASRDDIITEIGRKMSSCLRVGRVNLWMFNDVEESIECIGNYSAALDHFSKGEKLYLRDIPNYFQRLRSDRVLQIEDVYNDEVASEIKEVYCRPYKIGAMLDIPVRMEGKLVGVMCFEHLEAPRHWSETEVQFSLAISQVVALAFETRLRRKVQYDLIEALKEKELLMREMHHRIKNNLNIAISLLRLQASETDDAFVNRHLSQAQQRLFAMAKVHEHLYKTGSYLQVDLIRYFGELLDEFRNTTNQGVAIDLRTHGMNELQLETSRVINLGLIVTELLNNAIKYAFTGLHKSRLIQVSLEKHQEQCVLSVTDNGKGYDTQKTEKDSLGLSIVKGLVEQIDGGLNIASGHEGTNVTVTFPLLTSAL